MLLTCKLNNWDGIVNVLILLNLKSLRTYLGTKLHKPSLFNTKPKN